MNVTSTIDTEIDGGVCTITIRNPEKRNAIGYSMIREISAVLDELSADDDYYVLVLTGAGSEAFSAGFDLTQDRTERTDEQKELWPEMISKLETYEYPTIAMINGDTYGGAVELVANCDLRIAAEDARFGITPAKLGLVYRGSAIHKVVEIANMPTAKELLFTADPIAADRANEEGMVNQVVSNDELEETTYEMADSIAENAPLSLIHMKEITHSIEQKGAMTEGEQKWVAEIRDRMFRSDDHQEGVEAFSEGRAPEFIGQ
ncbi:hypothetical protein CP556_22315 [Natrinema sp. CBA1119]|nr:hypothetical protein CP556_22315 [Natrinema sp. CBA1119]